MKNRRWSNY